MESSDRSEKVVPRIAHLAVATVAAYAVLSTACAVAYLLAGMTPFEAVVHAMTTISTGGYSTSDASMGHFANPWVDWIATLFMAAAALPFVIYIQAIQDSPRAFWRTRQIRHFLSALAVAILALTCWLWLERDEAFFRALRLAAFNVVSVVTTTGYATADYAQWGTFANVLFFLLTFMGGCTGSTAGGIKMLRFDLAGVMVRNQFRRLSLPHGVFPMRYQGRALADDVPRSAMNFFFVFIAAFAAIAGGLSLLGLDFTTAFSGAATAIANVGPGLGSVIGPAGNFSTLPDAAKWLLAAGMLLGRLEFFTVLVVILPSFWRG